MHGDLRNGRQLRPTGREYTRLMSLMQLEVSFPPLHKLRNLERYAPCHALEEVKSDYHRIVYAESLEKAKKALPRFYLEVEKAGAQGGGVVWKKREKSC